MSRPNLTERCQTCTHTFSDHAQSYGGAKHGCLVVEPGDYGPYDNPSPSRRCGCKGFSQMYHEPTDDYAAPLRWMGR